MDFFKPCKKKLKRLKCIYLSISGLYSFTPIMAYFVDNVSSKSFVEVRHVRILLYSIRRMDPLLNLSSV